MQRHAACCARLRTLQPRGERKLRRKGSACGRAFCRAASWPGRTRVIPGNEAHQAGLACARSRCEVPLSLLSTTCTPRCERAVTVPFATLRFLRSPYTHLHLRTGRHHALAAARRAAQRRARARPPQRRGARLRRGAGSRLRLHVQAGGHRVLHQQSRRAHHWQHGAGAYRRGAWATGAWVCVSPGVARETRVACAAAAARSARMREK